MAWTVRDYFCIILGEIAEFSEIANKAQHDAWQVLFPSTYSPININLLTEWVIFLGTKKVITKGSKGTVLAPAPLL
jgi:hypothetical protein